MFQRSNVLRGVLCAALAPLVAGAGAQAQDVVKSANGVTWVKVAPYDAPTDVTHARPMPMPEATMTEDAVHGLMESMRTEHVNPGGSGFVPGNEGTGSRTEFAPVYLGKPEGLQSDAVHPRPEDWGTSNLPFTTVRADLYGLATNTDYPYRAVGKLFFDITRRHRDGGPLRGRIRAEEIPQRLAVGAWVLEWRGALRHMDRCAGLRVDFVLQRHRLLRAIRRGVRGRCRGAGPEPAKERVCGQYGGVVRILVWRRVYLLGPGADHAAWVSGRAGLGRLHGADGFAGVYEFLGFEQSHHRLEPE